MEELWKNCFLNCGGFLRCSGIECSRRWGHSGYNFNADLCDLDYNAFFFVFGLFEVMLIISNDKVPSRISGLLFDLIPSAIIPKDVRSQIIASDVHFVQPMTVRKKHFHENPFE